MKPPKKNDRLHQKMLFHSTLTAMALVALFEATLAEAVQGFEGSKPNIIIVMPDDIGYGDIACLGNPVVQTPSIDSLKKACLLFTRYHVSARCSPSRATLMSRRHEFLSGVTHTQHLRDAFKSGYGHAAAGAEKRRI